MALGAEADRLFADLDRLLLEEADAADFAALYRRLRKFVVPSADQYGGCLSIVSGTLTALPRIAMFYGFRIPGETLRRIIYDCCIKEMRAIAATMAEATRALLAEAASGIGALPRTGGG